MTAYALHRDERTGLVLATLLHAAVLAALLIGRRDAAPVAEPDRVSVTISEDSAPTSTAPQPAAQAAPETAPQLGEPAPPAPAEARLEPQAAPPAPAPPVRQPERRPQPIARAQPRPAVRAPSPPPPAANPPPRPARAPPAPARSAPPRAAATRTPPARTALNPGRAPATTTPPRQAGGSRIGADFLRGVANAPATAARGQPAAAIGAAERASLASSIARQLKPNWTAPQGADAERLVTVLTWDLDANGRLKGKPRVVSQQGITDSNRAQSARHAEQAIRAVELAAPFELPAQYYAAWRHVAAFRFDRRLSQ